MPHHAADRRSGAERRAHISEVDYPSFAPTEASDNTFFQNGFDPSIEMKTQGGFRVSIITTNGPGPSPVIGLIWRNANEERKGGVLHRWTLRGVSYDACLENVRKSDLAKNVIIPFYWDRSFRTRDGRGARLLTTDRRGERTHVCLVDPSHGTSEQTVVYYPNGKVRLNGDSANDLVNALESTMSAEARRT